MKSDIVYQKIFECVLLMVMSLYIYIYNVPINGKKSNNQYLDRLRRSFHLFLEKNRQS